MYWYVKLVLYLILLVFVLLVGRCGYRWIVAPRLESAAERRERVEQDVEPEDQPVATPADRTRPRERRAVALPAEQQRVLDTAARQLDGGNLLAARALAHRVLQFDQAEIFSAPWWEAAKIVSQVNTRVVNTDMPAPEKQRYRVQEGDALARIARRFGTTVEAIQRMNNMTPERSMIYVGDILYVLEGDWSILVSKEHFALVLYNGDELFKVYEVGIGRQDRTPTGTFVVRNKLREPDWTPPGRRIPYGDPENVLGTRWIGLLPVGDTDPTLSGYGIHGTWEPETIGTAASQGCVRLRNQEVEELYALIPHPRWGEQALRENPERGILVTIQE